MATKEGSVKKEKQPYFHNDLAIEQIEQDELDRSKFAQSLASGLANRPKDSSLVVGLTGKWGEGKTSLVNLILRYFEKEHKKVQVTNFPVWSLTSRDEIHDEFFASIEKAIGKSSDETLKQKAARWRLVAAKVEVAGSWVPIFIAILTVIGTTISSMIAGSFGMIYGIIVSVLISFAAFLLSKYKIAATIVGKFAALRKTEASIRREDLETVKKELQEALRESDITVVVIIDDMDRLAPDEVKLVFQLLKGNGDLSNVIYILPYDENLLAKSVEEALPNTDGHGLDYLDKIVQVRFRVPPPDVHEVRKILNKRLNELIGATIDSQTEIERWGMFSYAGVIEPFRTLRDVYRFLNAFKISLSILKASESFAINRTDLLVLEIIKFFEPTVYESIPAMKSEIMKGPSRDLKGVMEGEKTPIDKIVDFSSEPNKEVMDALLKILFPQQRQIIGQDQMLENYRYFRVCHPDLFDRYFTLLIPEGQILPVEQASLMAARDEGKKLSAIYRAIIQDGRLNALLDYLYAYSEELAEVSDSEFLRSLFQIESDLPHDRNSDFLLRPEDQIVATAIRLLKKRPLLVSIDTLKKVLALGEGVSILSIIIIRITKNDSDFFLNNAGRDSLEGEKKEEIIRDLKEAAVRNIENASQTNALINHSQLIFLLCRWQDWKPGDGFATWFSEALKSKDKAIKVLAACEFDQTSPTKRKVYQYQNIVTLAKSAGCLGELEAVPVLIESEDSERATILRDILNGNVSEE